MGMWRTEFEPLPDITAYELAVDQKLVNPSQIISDRNLFLMRTALRHRITVLSSGETVRMDVLALTWKSELAKIVGIEAVAALEGWTGMFRDFDRMWLDLVERPVGHFHGLDRIAEAAEKAILEMRAA